MSFGELFDNEYRKLKINYYNFIKLSILKLLLQNFYYYLS